MLTLAFPFILPFFHSIYTYTHTPVQLPCPRMPRVNVTMWHNRKTKAKTKQTCSSLVTWYYITSKFKVPLPEESLFTLVVFLLPWCIHEVFLLSLQSSPQRLCLQMSFLLYCSIAILSRAEIPRIAMIYACLQHPGHPKIEL